MPFTLALPDEYPYVLAVASLTTFVNFYHSMLTGKYRRAAKVPYPNAYVTAAEASASPDAHAFNCAQKAHANFTETQPSVVISMLLAGLNYPVASAGLGAVWAIGRVMYAGGYVKSKEGENGKGRMVGIFAAPAQYVLILMGLGSAVKLIMA